MTRSKAIMRIQRVGLRNSLVAYLFLTAYAAVILVPILYLYNSSMRSTLSLFSEPLAVAWPLHLDNYRAVLLRNDFLRYLRNSVIITAGAIGLNVLLSTPAAYALARYKSGVAAAVYAIFLIGLMIPLELASVPLFLIMRDLGLLDTHLSLILVYAGWRFGFSALVLYGFFFTLPANLEDAARIDGANEFQLFFRVMLPLSRAGIVIAIIYNAVPIWNDFFFPLIFLRSPRLSPLPLAVSNFFGENSAQWGPLFAFLGLSILPIVVLYLALSRYFIRGMLAGSFR